MAKPKISPSESALNKKLTTEIVGLSNQAIDVPKLVNHRDKLFTFAKMIERLQQKVDGQAKEYIKLHKRGRGMFALKRLRLYSNFMQDIQNLIEQLEKGIMGRDVTKQDIKKTTRDAENLIANLEELSKVEGPLKSGEDLKQREEKFKALFKKHHIENTDIYSTFAEYEAEALEITLTTSCEFKLSDKTSASTLPGSENVLDN